MSLASAPFDDGASDPDAPSVGAGLGAGFGAVGARSGAPGVVPGGTVTGSRAERVRALQERIRGMQRTTLPETGLPTAPELVDVLPGGALQKGSSYVVAGSTSLVLAMLAGPSGAGSWCGVVGMPTLGVEAARAAGVDLARLVLVPDPGDQWMAVTAALAEVLTVVVTCPPARVRDSDAQRLAARLRQNGSVLVSAGEWPGADARLVVTGSEWGGTADGTGYPTGHRLTVEVSGRGVAGRARPRRVLLPDDAGTGTARGVSAGVSASAVLAAVPAAPPVAAPVPDALPGIESGPAAGELVASGPVAIGRGERAERAERLPRPFGRRERAS